MQISSSYQRSTKERVTMLGASLGPAILATNLHSSRQVCGRLLQANRGQDTARLGRVRDLSASGSVSTDSLPSLQQSGCDLHFLIPNLFLPQPLFHQMSGFVASSMTEPMQIQEDPPFPAHNQLVGPRVSAEASSTSS